MAELTAAKRTQLPDNAFAYLHSNGKRYLPINDEAHVRNALSRFEQVPFETASAKDGARKRLLVAAKKYGIVPIGFITGQFRSQEQASERLRGRSQVEHSTNRRLPTGTVTLLLTDIEGSTTLLRRLGDAYGQVLDDHRDIIRAAVLAGGGHEIDARADEFFAAFERPLAALQAAIAVQRDLAAHDWPHALELRVRAGIHTGRPLFRRSDYVGLPVHVAARISSAAHGGQILLSSASFNALADDWPDGILARSIGAFTLAGLPDPEELYQVMAPDLPADFPAPRVFETPKAS
jgi:class 3 adenylate cyclase